MNVYLCRQKFIIVNVLLFLQGTVENTISTSPSPFTFYLSPFTFHSHITYSALALSLSLCFRGLNTLHLGNITGRKPIDNIHDRASAFLLVKHQVKMLAFICSSLYKQQSHHTRLAFCQHFVRWDCSTIYYAKSANFTVVLYSGLTGFNSTT